MYEEKPLFNIHNFLTLSATIMLPLYASIYFILWLIFDVGGVEWVLGILALLSLACGLLLRVGSARYHGQIVVREDEEGKKTFLLELNGDPEKLELMDVVSFKVTHEATPGYGDLAD